MIVEPKQQYRRDKALLLLVVGNYSTVKKKKDVVPNSDREFVRRLMSYNAWI